MFDLFVYATLKKKAVREAALDEKHDVPHTRDIVIAAGWKETTTNCEKQLWPTIYPFEHGYTKGEILVVQPYELAKLDDWEDHYKRIMIKTSDGPAWTYIFRRPLK